MRRPRRVMFPPGQAEGFGEHLRQAQRRAAAKLYPAVQLGILSAVETVEDRLAAGIRYDPQRARRGVRRGKERGVWVYVPAAELRAAGIDPHGEPPTYKMWTRGSGRGSVLLRFYR